VGAEGTAGRAITSGVPLRAMPHPGATVLIDYLGTTLQGTVTAVADDGRELEVVTEEGTALTFTLNRATATFTAGGGQTGPRLRFVAGEQ
jgi:hypothetical protein